MSFSFFQFIWVSIVIIIATNMFLSIIGVKRKHNFVVWFISTGIIIALFIYNPTALGFEEGQPQIQTPKIFFEEQPQEDNYTCWHFKDTGSQAYIEYTYKDEPFCTINGMTVECWEGNISDTCQEVSRWPR